MKLHWNQKLRENVQNCGDSIVWVTISRMRSTISITVNDNDYISFTGVKMAWMAQKVLAFRFTFSAKTINFKDGCCQCLEFSSLCLIYDYGRMGSAGMRESVRFQELRENKGKNQKAEK